ncbi:MAG: hypothetical protein ABI840_05730 [bacterium]
MKNILYIVVFTFLLLCTGCGNKFKEGEWIKVKIDDQLILVEVDTSTFSESSGSLTVDFKVKNFSSKQITLKNDNWFTESDGNLTGNSLAYERHIKNPDFHEGFYDKLNDFTISPRKENMYYISYKDFPLKENEEVYWGIYSESEDGFLFKVKLNPLIIKK